MIATQLSDLKFHNSLQWVVMHSPTSKEDFTYGVISYVLCFADYISLIDVFSNVFRRGYSQLSSCDVTMKSL